ncbi:unnamed protein product [Linum tenue]|uniref:Uncharacterized protein n=1 Tax=Linum tenue TaxID=586396 RepID=A0AAV0MJ52_9ROSI|nr:unnamed protein product [Linum tenue]
MSQFNPALDEIFFISSFINGLEQELRLAMSMMQPQTLAEAYQQARLEEVAIETCKRKKQSHLGDYLEMDGDTRAVTVESFLSPNRVDGNGGILAEKEYIPIVTPGSTVKEPGLFYSELQGVSNKHMEVAGYVYEDGRLDGCFVLVQPQGRGTGFDFKEPFKELCWTVIPFLDRLTHKGMKHRAEFLYGQPLDQSNVMLSGNDCIVKIPSLGLTCTMVENTVVSNVPLMVVKNRAFFQQPRLVQVDDYSLESVSSGFGSSNGVDKVVLTMDATDLNQLGFTAAAIIPRELWLLLYYFRTSTITSRNSQMLLVWTLENAIKPGKWGICSFLKAASVEACFSYKGYELTSESVGCKGKPRHGYWGYGYRVFPTYYGVCVFSRGRGKCPDFREPYKDRNISQGSVCGCLYCRWQAIGAGCCGIVDGWQLIRHSLG